MKRLGPEQLDLLAGTYLLGTLRGGARRRFEALLRSDPELQRRVAAWERDLGRLTDPILPQEPPPRVWDAIERALPPEQRPAAQADGTKQGLTGLGLSKIWRPLAFAAVFAAGIALLALGWSLSQVPDWGAEMVAHLVKEPAALEARQQLTPDALSQALAPFGLRAAAPLGDISFLRQCVVADRRVLHLVVTTPFGRATLILLPGETAAPQPDRQLAGHAVRLVPLHGSLLGLILDRVELLPLLEAHVRQGLAHT
jgi:hypothetical protein